MCSLGFSVDHCCGFLVENFQSKDELDGRTAGEKVEAHYKNATSFSPYLSSLEALLCENVK